MDDAEGTVRVRADVAGFAADADAMRRSLEDALGGAGERGARALETNLARAVRSGKLGFDDLKSAGLRAMDEVAAAALKAGIGAILGGGSAGTSAGGSASGVLGTLATGLLSSLLGLPGRATGGPVAPGRAYRVGERGPELFVPTASGQVVPSGAAPAGGGRDVRVSVTINAGGGTGAPEALARSGRQVARAVRAALRED